MKLNRRSLIASTAGLAGMALAPKAARSAVEIKKRYKFGVSSYCYWHFRPPKVSIHGVIDRAAALGAEGVDVLHRQMDSEDPAYLRSIKRHAFINGVDLICLSIHQDFVDPDPSVRAKNIAHTEKCIEMAYEMGIP
ncbi:MAG: sugar phosphate isomerase/epimerase family protein, partial [Candidatus Hinthialibacter sp.]